MKKIFLILVLVFSYFYSFSKVDEKKYQLGQEYPMYNILIEINNIYTIDVIASFGINLEESKIIDNKYIDIIINQNELDILNKTNINFTFKFPEYLSKRNKTSQKKFSNNNVLESENPYFQFGSIGGYYKLEEIYQQFDKMRELFPIYCFNPDTIGFSCENRPIIAYSFANIYTDNIKPQSLITALHHAREPAGVMAVVYFLWDILHKTESSNEEALYLLNHRRISVVPVVNPDGYMFNQATFEKNPELWINDPSKRELWRKNRKYFDIGVYGVDLNRNYGPNEFWDYPNPSASSTVKTSYTYRGESAFSEPETQAIRNYCMNNNFRTVLNYHTYGGYLVYPYSAYSTDTQDSMIFRSMAFELTRDNVYTFGLDKYTIGYSTRGTSDDWMYYSENKNKVFSFTPELGHKLDNFWPESDRIIDIVKENLSMAYNSVWNPSTNLKIKDYYSYYDNNNKKAYIKLIIWNIGLDSCITNFPVELKSLNNSLLIEKPFDTLKILQPSFIDTLSYEITVKQKIKNGSDYPFIVSIQQDGINRIDTIKPVLYSYYVDTIISSNNYETDWYHGDWYIEEDENSNIYLSDSYNNNYYNKTENYLSLKNEITIKPNCAILEYDTKYHIEPSYDCGVVQISEDGGNSWKYLKADRMNTGYGLEKSKLPIGCFGYYGYMPDWIRQEIRLDGYLVGKNILIRFGMLSDDGVCYNGWELKNIKIKYFNDTLDTSVRKEIKIEDFDCFPSPVYRGDYLKVSFKNDINYFSTKPIINIYNILGQCVLSQCIETITIPQTTLYIKTDKLGSGTYKLDIILNDKILSKNFIIIQ